MVDLASLAPTLSGAVTYLPTAADGSPALGTTTANGTYVKKPTLTPTPISSTSSAATSSDTFTSGATLTGRSTPVGSLPWTTTGTWNIASNQVTPSATTDNLQATFNGLSPRCTIIADVISTGTGATTGIKAAVMFRWIDANNFFYYQVDSYTGFVQCFRVTGGSHTLLAESASASPSGVVTTLRVDLCGPDITLWANGTELLSFAERQGIGATAVGFRQGAPASPTTTAKFNNIQVLPFQGVRFNWPNIPVSACTQIIDIGGAATWDSTDVNNPVPVWDPVNQQWALYYSGYYNGGTVGANTSSTVSGGGDNGIQRMGVAYAKTLSGPWTKEAANPVYADDAAGRDNMDGSMVWFNGEWIHIYVSGANTRIDLARATSLTGPWTKQGTALSASGTETACVDPFLRVRQDGVTLELWYTTDNGNTRHVNYATSTDGGLTWVKQGGGTSPIFTAPPFQNPTFMSQTGVYVPPGKEGQEMLCVFDSAFISGQPFSNTTQRRVLAALTVNGGASWHWRILARETGGAGFAAGQAFDPYFTIEGDTAYLFHSATNATNVTELNGPIRIAVRSAKWNPETLTVSSAT